MRKKIILSIILILTLCLTPLNAKAFEATAKFKSSSPTGILYRTEGSGAGIPYKSTEFVMRYNGNESVGYCVDPGLHANSGDKYSCAPNNDAGLEYLLSLEGGSYDYATLQLAFRFYAAKGIGNGQVNNLRAAIIRYQQIHDGLGAAMLLGCPDCPADPTKYLEDTTGAGRVEVAHSLYQEAAKRARLSGSSAGVSTGSGSIIYTPMPTTNNTLTINVATQFTVPEVIFKCKENCTIISQSWGGTSGVVTLNVPNCNKFELDAYYNFPGAVICTPKYNATSRQYVITRAEDSGVAAGIDTNEEPSDVYIDRSPNPLCTDTCLLPIPDIIVDIHNCCEEGGGVSKVIEPQLDELVCDRVLVYPRVKKFWPRKGYKKYLDENTPHNNYCELLCTERVYADLPMGISVEAGRYFEMTKQSHGTSSPYIQGSKRCRMLVDYDKWHTDYKAEVEAEILAYNNFQKAKGTWYLYKSAIEHSESKTHTFSAKCEYEEHSSGCQFVTDCKKKTTTAAASGTAISTARSASSEQETSEDGVVSKPDDTDKLGDMDTPETQETTKEGKTCAKDEEAIKGECPIPDGTAPSSSPPKKDDQTVTYKAFNFIPGLQKWYYYNKVKMDEEREKVIGNANNTHIGITMKEDGTGSITHSNFSVYKVWNVINEFNNWVSSNNGKTVKKLITHCTGESACDAKRWWTLKCERTDSKSFAEINTSEDENVEGKFNGELKSAYEGYQANFLTHTAKALELEEKIRECDKWFLEYEGADANKQYSFHPYLMNSSYGQVFLGLNGDLNHLESSIIYEEEVCEVRGPLFDSTALDITLGGAKIKADDAYYGNDDDEIMQDFAGVTLDWEETNRGYTKYKHEEVPVEKTFVHDARYEGECYWREVENVKKTFSPTGEVGHTTANYTTNVNQYQVYLTTLEGKYEVRWDVTGIGSIQKNGKGRFDSYFQNAPTCEVKVGGNDEGGDIHSTFTCTLNVYHTIMYVGKCNNIAISTKPCSKPKVLEPVMKFKVVDPTDIFPASGGTSTPSSSVRDDYSKQYAKNWTETDEGRIVMQKIESLARSGSGNTYAPSHISYQFTLSPTEMKKIREHNTRQENNNSGGYSDLSFICQSDDNEEACNAISGDQTCTRSKGTAYCLSTFIKNKYPSSISSTSNHGRSPNVHFVNPDGSI